MDIKKLTVKQVANLARKFLRGKATEEETKLLHEWYDSANAGNTEKVNVEAPTTSAQLGEEIFAGIKQKIEEEKRAAIPDRKVRVMPFVYSAAAAILLLVAGTIAYRSIDPPEKTIPQELVSVPLKEVIAPQSARAVLTLANGKKLFLDSLPNGTLAMQGNTRVIKMGDGEFVYEEAGYAVGLQYNVLVVPRGSRVVNLTLTDGTRVWLNAESSMRFPVAFNKNARGVEITGEAYFEVARDPQRRFYVSSGDLTTEVLGTHFNVNSYADESSMKVTLLEGRVRLSKSNGGQAMLKPGQQASVTALSGIRITDNIDTVAVIAWKNDHFMMKGTDLGTLARQMARWYDIEILFEGMIPDRKFGGSISRNVNLSTMLRALKESGIKSELEGRTVRIR